MERGRLLEINDTVNHPAHRPQNKINDTVNNSGDRPHKKVNDNVNNPAHRPHNESSSAGYKQFPCLRNVACWSEGWRGRENTGTRENFIPSRIDGKRKQWKDGQGHLNSSGGRMSCETWGVCRREHGWVDGRCWKCRDENSACALVFQRSFLFPQENNIPPSTHREKR